MNEDREFKKGERYLVEVVVEDDGPDYEDTTSVFVGEDEWRLFLKSADLKPLREEGKEE